MSVVSSYVILCSSVEDFSSHTLDGINAFDGIAALRGFRNIADCAGGGKAVQACVYAAAFNHFDDTAFTEHLRTKVPWREPDAVRVFRSFEGEMGFREVTPLIGAMPSED